MKLFDPDKNGFPVSGEENPPYHVVKCSFEKEESVVLKCTPKVRHKTFGVHYV